MIRAIRSAWDYVVETFGILLGVPKYLERGLDPEVKRIADTPSARSFYRHRR